MEKKKSILKNEIFITLVVLVVMVVIGLVSSRAFLTAMNIGNLFEQATALGIAALAQIFTLLLGNIDLSIGSGMACITTVMSFTLTSGRFSLAINIIIVLAMGLGIGLLNGLGVAKLQIPAFIMTLSTGMILHGLGLLLRPTPGGRLPDGYKNLLNGRLGIVTHGVILWIVLFIILFFVLERRRFGRDIYAVGGNANAAQLSGISPQKTTIKAYLLTGVLMATAGLYLSARVGSGDATIGGTFTNDSVTVCVLAGVSLAGGRGRIIGLIPSTFVMALINNVLNLAGVNTYWQYVFKGAIMIIVVMIFSIRDTREARKVAMA